MCLTTESKRCTVANKPIPCYKVVWKKPSKDGEPPLFTSEYFGFVYETGEEYCVKPIRDFVTERPEGRRSFSIGAGFHSYARLKDALDNRQDGLPWGQVILRCEIPAGARYWRGNKSHLDYRYVEYCSDRIRVVGWKFHNEAKWRTDISTKEEEPCA